MSCPVCPVRVRSAHVCVCVRAVCVHMCVLAPQGCLCLALYVCLLICATYLCMCWGEKGAERVRCVGVEGFAVLHSHPVLCDATSIGLSIDVTAFGHRLYYKSVLSTVVLHKIWPIKSL